MSLGQSLGGKFFYGLGVAYSLAAKLLTGGPSAGNARENPFSNQRPFQCIDGSNNGQQSESNGS